MKLRTDWGGAKQLASALYRKWVETGCGTSPVFYCLGQGPGKLEEKKDMMKKSKQIRMMAAVFACILAGTASAAPGDVPAARPSGLNDSGVQLSRTRQYLEWQRTMQRIAEGRETAQVEGSGGEMPQESGSQVRFQLKKVTVDPSSVLAAEELSSLTAAYEGREVTLQDLYELVGKINALYSEKGYLTCRAYLAPQTIRGGVVHISLIEGKTGAVTIAGNDTTREDYIRNRLSLREGEIADISDVNKDLLRFNASNDTQLRIAMKAGKEPGTTDYMITAYEPQKETFGLFSDNAGSETSGLYRGGMFWQDRSLSGVRDSLMMTSVFSEGTKSFGLSYNAPINASGTKIGLTYSGNSVHITDGPMEALDVRGHATAYGVSITHPVITNETVKAEVGVDYTWQNSQTDFMGMDWIDDTVQGMSFFYDQIAYGRTTVFYQRHAYRFGNYQDITGSDRSFGKYTLNTLYQKVWSAGQMLTARIDGQLSSTQYLPSAEQFYIGGVYSVRGYTESLLSGDSGVMGSVEYAVPLTPTKETSAYVFLDGGYVWGDSAYDDQSLIGAGFGVRTSLNDHLYFNVSMGFPLIHTVNDEEQSRARVHFSFNSQF